MVAFLPGSGPMGKRLSVVVDARTQFGCSHQYVARNIADAGLTCETCGLRTEMLRLERTTTFGRVVPFSSAAERTTHGSVATIGDR
jgi:hypothetical protein